VWVYETDPQKISATRTAAQSHLEDIREKVADIRAGYSDEDAVCPNCGRREFLKQWTQGWFCARSKTAGEPGGCGYPAKGERLDSPVTYGEFKQRTASTSVPWK
jgi:ribosomal protein L37AE/L43A